MTPSQRPTAIRMVSSSRRSPQLDMGSAWSQSPEWGALQARSLARWWLPGASASTAALSAIMEGLSQIDCLYGRGGEGSGMLCLVDETSSAASNELSAEQPHLERMRSWRTPVLAAEAKKVEDASEATRRMPRPPQRQGGLSVATGWPTG